MSVDIRTFKGLNTRQDSQDIDPSFATVMEDYDHTRFPGKLVPRPGYVPYQSGLFNAQKGFELLTRDGQRIYLMAQADGIYAKIDDAAWNFQATPDGCSIDSANVEFFAYRDRIYITSPGSPLMVFINVEEGGRYNSGTASNKRWRLEKASIVLSHTPVVAPKRVRVNPSNPDQILIATTGSGLEVRVRSTFELVRRIGTDYDADKLYFYQGNCLDVAEDGTYVYVTAIAFDKTTSTNKAIVLKLDPQTWDVVGSYGHGAGESNLDAMRDGGLAHYNGRLYIGTISGIVDLDTSDMSFVTLHSAGLGQGFSAGALDVDPVRGYLYVYQWFMTSKLTKIVLSNWTVNISYDVPFEVKSLAAEADAWRIMTVDTDDVVHSHYADDLQVAYHFPASNFIRPQGVTYLNGEWLICDFSGIHRWVRDPDSQGYTHLYVGRLDPPGIAELILTNQEVHEDENHILDKQCFYAVSVVYDDNEEGLLSSVVYVNTIPGTDKSITNHFTLEVEKNSTMDRVVAFHIWRADAPRQMNAEPATPFRFVRAIGTDAIAWSYDAQTNRYSYSFTDDADSLSTLSFEEMTGLPEFLRGKEVAIDTTTVLDGSVYAGGIHYTNADGNAVDLPQQIRWTPPGVMSQLPLSDDNYLNIGDASAGSAVALSSVYNRLVVFLEHAILMVFSDQVERTFEGYSIADKNSIAKYDNALFFATTDGIYLMQGYRISKISEMIADDMNITRARGIFLPQKREYRVTINGQKTYVYHLPTGSWRVYNYAFNNFYLSPDQELIGIKPDATFRMDTGSTDAGAPITPKWVSPWIQYSVDALKILKRVIVAGEGQLTLRVESDQAVNSFTRNQIAPRLIRYLRQMMGNRFRITLLGGSSYHAIESITLDLPVRSRLEMLKDRDPQSHAQGAD